MLVRTGVRIAVAEYIGVSPDKAERVGQASQAVRYFLDRSNSVPIDGLEEVLYGLIDGSSKLEPASKVALKDATAVVIKDLREMIPGDEDLITPEVKERALYYLDGVDEIVASVLRNSRRA